MKRKTMALTGLCSLAVACITGGFFVYNNKPKEPSIEHKQKAGEIKTINWVATPYNLSGDEKEHIDSSNLIPWDENSLVYFKEGEVYVSGSPQPFAKVDGKIFDVYPWYGKAIVGYSKGKSSTTIARIDSSGLLKKIFDDNVPGQKVKTEKGERDISRFQYYSIGVSGETLVFFIPRECRASTLDLSKTNSNEIDNATNNRVYGLLKLSEEKQNLTNLKYLKDLPEIVMTYSNMPEDIRTSFVSELPNAIVPPYQREINRGSFPVIINGAPYSARFKNKPIK